MDENNSVKIMLEKFNNTLKLMIVTKHADNDFFMSANEFAEKICNALKSKEFIAGNGEKKTTEYRLRLEHWKTQVLTYAIFYPGC